MVEVIKTTNGVVNPTLDLQFTVGLPSNPLGSGITATTLGDQDGILQFSVKLLPGATYSVCETNVPAGFSSLWTIGGNVISPYNPDQSQVPPQDLGNRCYDFTVQSGQTLTIEVDNTRPGGAPRTIGYWKNWNLCTGGGQAANAARNGGAANGFFLMEDLLPQLVGDFNITTCTQGVKVLDKRDQQGRKKADDAAYELAAQLFAARLNMAAGAETCSAIETAIVNGQSLLDAINFTGSGNYLGPKSNSPNRATAISLASQLDVYNNGNLCQ